MSIALMVCLIAPISDANHGYLLNSWRTCCGLEQVELSA